MTKLPRKKNQGFTLIELMIVVVIIGILAATAIPAFLRFVNRTKTAETGIQLKALFEGAAAYYAREFVPRGWTSTISAQTSCFIGNASIDRVITGTAGQSKNIWNGTTGTNFAGLTGGTPGSFGLGWQPADPLYYTYAITNSRTGCRQGAIGAALTFVASGNLDGDALTSNFEMSSGVIEGAGLSHAPLFVANELE